MGSVYLYRQENPFRGFELATLTNSPEKLEQVASGRMDGGDGTTWMVVEGMVVWDGG